jgi:hypothetical protein
VAALSPIRRRIAAVLLVLCVALFGGLATYAVAQQADSGISTTPIVVSGSLVYTWASGNERIFFVNGNGRIEQGSTVLSLPRGVVWVNDQTQNLTNAYFLDVYGEDGVRLTKDGKTDSGPRGVASLLTRGSIQISSGTSTTPPVQQNMSSDPMFQRALQERSRIGNLRATSGTTTSVAAFGDIQQAQGFAPTDAQAPPLPPGAIPQTLPPAPPSPTPPPPAPPFFGPAAAPAPIPPVAPPIVPAKTGTPKTFILRPRSGEPLNVRKEVAPNGETVYVVPQPIILWVLEPTKALKVLDLEADRMVLWTKGDGKKQIDNMSGPGGETTQHIEIYLAGNVEFRTENDPPDKAKKETQTLRCTELYYDVDRNVAIANKADLQIKQPKLPDAIHIQSAQLLQLNSKIFTADKAIVSSSKLPSDPALTVYVQNVVVEEREVPQKSIWGYPKYNKDGTPIIDKVHDVNGTNMWLNFEGVPFFYFPYLSGTLEDPLGPIRSFTFGYDTVFGAKLGVELDTFELLGMDKPTNAHWTASVDYFSERGPALGTEFKTEGKDLFGIANSYSTHINTWGIYDTGTDVIGGNRGTQAFMTPILTFPVVHPDWRGWFLAETNIQGLPNGFTVQAKTSLVSDVNFMEQYHQQNFLNDLNQENFLYLKQQQENWAWTAMGTISTQPWYTQTEWLPKADGWLLGEKLFEYFTVDVHGTMGWAQYRPTTIPPLPYEPSDLRGVNTGVFNLWSEVSLPFDVGPFRMVPYVVLNGAFYTESEDGAPLGDLYGGAGLRASIPFSRLYPDVQSDLFNLDGMYHKVTLTSNYLYAQSTERISRFPQTDRLNDDTTDQALRDIFYQQILINPSNAAFLTTSPLVNPQVYALQRLVDNRIDTLDRLDIVQLGVEQRLQTLRGFGASEHVVDWMSLNLGVSIFPEANRDNQGQTFGILEYDYVWNIGDRTALVSNGWFDPSSGGPRAWNFGGYLGKADGTNLYLGYRELDPLNSKAVVGTFTYAFSEKYKMTASTTWDFAANVQSYTLGITRIGTDIQITLDLNYNSITKTTGFQVEIIPNLLASKLGAGAGLLSPR